MPPTFASGRCSYVGNMAQSHKQVLEHMRTSMKVPWAMVLMTLCSSGRLPSSRVLLFLGNDNRPRLNRLSRLRVLWRIWIHERDMRTNYSSHQPSSLISLVSLFLASSPSPFPSPPNRKQLTSCMLPTLRIIHHKRIRLTRCLFFQPEPLMIRVVGQVVDLTNPIWDDSIGCYEI